jgi:hypothetical protein
MVGPGRRVKNIDGVNMRVTAIGAVSWEKF